MKNWAKSIRNKDRVLDVGCGEGRLLQDIKANIDYTGIDFSTNLLDLAKDRHGGKNHKFITGDITKGDVWKNLKRFDKIFAVAVIHHFPSKKEQLYVLMKMKDHLKPGGKIYVSFWNLWQKKFWKEHLKSFCKFRKLTWVEIPFRGTKLKRLYFAGGKKYWERLLKEAGWKNVEIKLDKGKKNMWTVLG